MSRAYDVADLIKARLKTAPAEGELSNGTNITGIRCVVDRQHDIEFETDKIDGKTTGALIVIFAGGFNVIDENAPRPRVSQRYTVTLWSLPILTKGGTPADDIAEQITLRLWQWKVASGDHALDEATVGRGGTVQDAKFLCHTIELSIPLNL